MTDARTLLEEGPNHAGWEQFGAVMESLADSMDDGPMVTNAAGVEFLDALARRGYEVRPAAAAEADTLRQRVAALEEARKAAITLSSRVGRMLAHQTTHPMWPTMVIDVSEANAAFVEAIAHAATPTPATDPRQRPKNVGGPAVAAYFATPATDEAGG